MKKLQIVLAIIVVFSFLIVGCGEELKADDSKINVTLKAIDSDSNIIETVAISINKKDSKGSEGVYTFELEPNTEYTASVKDTSGLYGTIKKTFRPGTIDTTIPVEFAGSFKTISLRATDSESNLINAVISIEGIKPVVKDGTYQFKLHLGSFYTATATDPDGVYPETTLTFPVLENIDTFSIRME